VLVVGDTKMNKNGSAYMWLATPRVSYLLLVRAEFAKGGLGREVMCSFLVVIDSHEFLGDSRIGRRYYSGGTLKNIRRWDRGGNLTANT
jgi:hypothetical protein